MVLYLISMSIYGIRNGHDVIGKLANAGSAKREATDPLKEK